jgi:hypothetical protein
MMTQKIKWRDNYDELYKKCKFNDPERNQKIRESKLGDKNPMFNNSAAADHLNKIHHTCIYCGKVSTLGNIVR